jgi:RNA polymerase sigma factor (sigma-70 family)
MSEPHEASVGFDETRWSRVRLATDDSSEGHAALEHLCARYWPPLYVFLRRHGRSDADAKDCVQGFLAQFLGRNDFARVSPDKGKFRSYLLRSLENYLASDHRTSHSLKRGGHHNHISIDDAEAQALITTELRPDLSAQQTFDRQWVTMLLTNALNSLALEQRDAGLESVFTELSPWLTTPPDAGAYEALAARLGKTKAGIAMSVKRLRERFRELVRAEVRETCRTPGDFAEEWEALRSLL